MKFMCLGYTEEKRWHAMSKSELADVGPLGVIAQSPTRASKIG
jgi:hypothetical protein